jgi:hypothetical protein
MSNPLKSEEGARRTGAVRTEPRRPAPSSDPAMDDLIER